MIRLYLIGSGLALALFAISPIAALAQANPELHKTKETANCKDYLGKPVPRFRIAHKQGGRSDQVLVIQGSISPKDVEEDKLLALSCKLGNEYAKAEVLIVWIFDCFQCAKDYNPLLGDTLIPNLKFEHRGAEYSFSRGEKDSHHNLRWWPHPDAQDTWVAINLGPPPQRPAPRKK
jgi:hypothetical protein